MKNGTQINYDEWQSAITELGRARADVIPSGWVTPTQMSAPGTLTKAGIVCDHARKVLIKLYRDGKADRKQFMVEVSPGFMRLVYHYRLKK